MVSISVLQSTRIKVESKSPRAVYPAAEWIDKLESSFTSETADGERLITDNMHTPYGGFYPDNWNVIRRPGHVRQHPYSGYMRGVFKVWT